MSIKGWAYDLARWSLRFLLQLLFYSDPFCWRHGEYEVGLVELPFLTPRDIRLSFAHTYLLMGTLIAGVVPSERANRFDKP